MKKEKTYKLVLRSWGGTEEDFLTGLTLRQAEQIGDNYGWQFDAGYIWDMFIDEE